MAIPHISASAEVTGTCRSAVSARLLRVDYKTLYLKIKRFGIDAGKFRA